MTATTRHPDCPHPVCKGERCRVPHTDQYRNCDCLAAALGEMPPPRRAWDGVPRFMEWMRQLPPARQGARP